MESNTNTDMAGTSDTPSQSTELRKKKIRDLLNEALADPDTLDANIGAMNAQLMEITNRYAELVIQALDGPLEDTIELDEMLPRLDRVAKLTNINERLSSWLAKRKAK